MLKCARFSLLKAVARLKISFHFLALGSKSLLIPGLKVLPANCKFFTGIMLEAHCKDTIDKNTLPLYIALVPFANKLVYQWGMYHCKYTTTHNVQYHKTRTS